MSNTTAAITCPAPFLSGSNFLNDTGGYERGRLCADVIPGLSCCLPCPTTQWLYSDDFEHDVWISRWLNVPSIVLQCFLLVTFLLLPEEFTHRHFLSIGLTVAVILFQLAFLIPLGSEPEQCYNEVTPGDMYTSTSCRTTGVLLIGGGMAIAVWVMLRSLWSHLRVCWDFRHPNIFFWFSIVTGIGLPGLFLALTLTLTGVSYQVGATCFPNNQNAFETWFGWLIAFGSLGAIMQLFTTGFCLWLYLRDYRKGVPAEDTGFTQQSEGIDPSTRVSGFDHDINIKKLAWRRVRKVLRMQWRSMILNCVVVILVIYFGSVFVKETRVALQTVASGDFAGLADWAICLISNGGDKTKCTRLATILGLSENSVLATFIMGSLVGTFTFSLMFRGSMLKGWLRLLREPRKFLRAASIGEEGFVMMDTKRKSFGRPLQSEKDFSTFDNEPLPTSFPQNAAPGISAPGILPDPTDSRNTSVATGYRKGSRSTSFPPSSGGRHDSSTLGPVPEAGDVSKRRETQNLMELLNQGMDEEDARRARKADRKLDDVR